VIDGSFGAGEWDPAGRAQFNVLRSPAEGGGVVPATLYVMNDAQNLYVALRVSNASVGTSRLSVWFDANHDGSFVQEGEDALVVDDYGDFWDRFIHQISPNLWRAVDDDDYGGTLDGTSADGDDAGFATFELAHPLDDADNFHDFSLRPAVRTGFGFFFTHCIDFTCANTSEVSGSDIVIVSGSTVPPDTQIAAGPVDGSLTREADARFEFTGTDDVIPATALTFECSLDNAAWADCASPLSPSVDDGVHTFVVRSKDEMLVVDPTPAQRNWTLDTTGPSKPVIRGRRSVRKGQRVVLRFSATDEIAGGVRFKCAVDSTRLKRCPAVYRVKLRPGRHVVRVGAVDRLGNQGEVATFRIRVKRARR
jgi:hypothetical protein